MPGRGRYHQRWVQGASGLRVPEEIVSQAESYGSFVAPMGSLRAVIRKKNTSEILDILNLGDNIVVNQGRSNLAHLMAGDGTSNRFVDQAKWSNGGHDTMSPSTPLAVAVTDGDLTNADAGVTAAIVLGSLSEPFNTVGANGMDLDIDNAGATGDFTITSGTSRTAAQVAADINAQVAGIASDVGGQVELRSTTFGTTSEVDILAAASDAYGVLGFTVSTTNGANQKDTTFAFPDGAGGNRVRFDVTLLATEANGGGSQEISEMGLFDDTDTMMCRKTFGLITKTNQIAIDWEWTIDFTKQS